MHLGEYRDGRGVLRVFDNLPFPVKRVFTITEATAPRGNHAHRVCHQIIIAVQGAFNVIIGTHCYEMRYPLMALWVPPGENAILDTWTEDAMALVLCSHHYDPEDYVYESEVH